MADVGRCHSREDQSRHPAHGQQPAALLDLRRRRDVDRQRRARAKRRHLHVGRSPHQRHAVRDALDAVGADHVLRAALRRDVQHLAPRQVGDRVLGAGRRRPEPRDGGRRARDDLARVRGQRDRDRQLLHQAVEQDGRGRLDRHGSRFRRRGQHLDRAQRASGRDAPRHGNGVHGAREHLLGRARQRRAGDTAMGDAAPLQQHGGRHRPVREPLQRRDRRAAEHPRRGGRRRSCALPAVREPVAEVDVEMADG